MNTRNRIQQNQQTRDFFNWHKHKSRVISPMIVIFIWIYSCVELKCQLFCYSCVGNRWDISTFIKTLAQFEYLILLIKRECFIMQKNLRGTASWDKWLQIQRNQYGLYYCCGETHRVPLRGVMYQHRPGPSPQPSYITTFIIKNFLDIRKKAFTITVVRRRLPREMVEAGWDSEHLISL